MERLRFCPSLLLAVLLAAPAFAYQDSSQAIYGGAISGRVTLTGTAPKPSPLVITKDRDVCGRKPLYDQSLLVGPDGGIADAVVTLPVIVSGKPFKAESAVKFDQVNCEYVPHVAVFPAGSTVDILNSDGILHNIHTYSRKNPALNLAQPGFKREIQVTIDRPEVIHVECDAHNWMSGWWYVTGNPYYAVTDQSGNFSIKDIPPGTYTVEVWQEKLGRQRRSVAVKAGATTTADFRFPVVRH